jgi:hypothetical protein
MKYQMTKLLFLGIIILSSACTRRDAEYVKSLERFDPYQVDHFPFRTSYKYSISNVYSSRFGTVGFFLTQKMTKEDIDSLKSYSISKGAEEYISQSKCLLIVDKQRNIDNEFDTRRSSEKILKANSKECLKDKLPIPNFYSLNRKYKLNSNQLPKGFLIYVLDAQKITNKEERTKNNMPEMWKHGFSKGLAIDEINLETIFWIIEW